MTEEAHIYRMAYSHLVDSLTNLIDQCYDDRGKPRIPPAAALSQAIQCVPEGSRKNWLTKQAEIESSTL